MANSAAASVARRFLPILGWIPGYRHDWLLPDILAGLALWAVMVPGGWLTRASSVCRPSWGSTQ